jgi:hypothetical protein
MDPAQALILSGFSTFDIADYGSGTSGVLDLHTVDFTNYDAVVVASDWGGWLWQRELNILNARAAELANYVNAGGGLVAFAESGHEMAQGGTTENQFAFVPFVVGSSQVDQTETQNTLTQAGLDMGLTVDDVNGNFSHNTFTSDAGMDVIDQDPSGGILSLATRDPIAPAGRIVVRKDAVPNSSQDFSFTTGGGLSPGTFNLDDDSDPTLSSSITLPAAAGSGYSISETSNLVWEQASATCDDGSPVSNINVSPGETVTCTFVNYPRAYARPRAASPMTYKLVPAIDACTSPNSTHAGAPSSASCRPPIQSSSYLTFNAPDRQAPYNTTANGSGMVTLNVTCHTPGTTTETGQAPPCPAAGDQQDIRITSSLSDVRCVAVSGGCSTAGGQYGGKLLGAMTLRVTDRRNGPSQTSAGAIVDSPLSWGIQCSSGSCSSITSGDAVLPGLVPEGKRTIYEIVQLEILDGGADGDLAISPSPASGSCLPACTGNDDETVFLRPGLFAP